MSQSRFGRIPQATVQLLEQTRDQVRSQVLTALPLDAGQDVRNVVIEQVIGIVLRDWQKNENTTGLTPADVRDMQSFVKAAAAIAGSDLNRDGLPVFRVVLSGMLEEWLANWNAPNDPGPPGPIN